VTRFWQIDLAASGIRRVVAPLGGPCAHSATLTARHQKFRESGDVEVIERLVRKYSKFARGGLRPITLDRLEALLRDDGQDEEQGTEQQQQ
jgi:hypothetical protein